MSLRLRQALPGQATISSRHNTCAGSYNGQTVIAYTSGSNVILLDQDHDLVETLPFWSALPHRVASSSTQAVDGVAANQEGGLLIAWSGVYVVLWQQTRTRIKWDVHSTLVAGSPISAVDYNNGRLALGTRTGVDYWQHDAKSPIVVWDRLWESFMPAPAAIAISPSTGHIATFAEGERCVRVLSMSAKGTLSGVPQEMRHPREVVSIVWRTPRAQNADAYLYTITANSVLRVYAPVLDDPTWFQLHLTMDGRSFSPSARLGAARSNTSTQGAIWPLEGQAVRAALLDALTSGEAEDTKKAKEITEEVRRKLQAAETEEGDVVLWIGLDGDVGIKSILNMDRKPPTLLKSQLLGLGQLTSPLTLPAHPLPSVISTTHGQVQIIVPATTTQPTVTSLLISLPDLFANNVSGLSTLPARTTAEAVHVHLSAEIDAFVRTPNGRGLMSIGADGEIGVWAKEQRGKPVRGRKGPKSLLGRGHWTQDVVPELCAIYAKGRAIVFYTHPPDGEGVITLQHLDIDARQPSPPVLLPSFQLSPGDRVAMLLAASDIDDGYSAAQRRTQRAIIIAVTERAEAWVWRVVSKKVVSVTSEADLDASDAPDIQLVSHGLIPTTGKAVHVKPVDPMGWHQSVIDWKTDSPAQDMVLTVSEEGVLEFWKPRLGTHLVNGQYTAHEPGHGGSNGDGIAHHDAAWTRSGVVRTDRTDIRSARCSSRKKTVLVRDLKIDGKGGGGGQEMTIWDSNVGEFSTGLEMTKIYPNDAIVQDLDWTTTSDLQSVLAVGFPHRIELVCEQRMSYAEGTPGWATFVTIDMTMYTPVPINDSIWLAGGSLAVGCGNQVYLFSRYLERDSPVPTPKSSVKEGKGTRTDDDEVQDVFELVASHNGPVLDYHPTLLAQCLLWNKVELVKRILISLSDALRFAEIEQKRRISWSRLDPSDFAGAVSLPAKPSPKASKLQYDSLFDISPDEVSTTRNDSDDAFNSKLVGDLTDHLEGSQIGIGLSHNDRSLLSTIAHAVLEVEVLRRALDLCGQRYLISLRIYVHEMRRALSGTTTPMPTPPTAMNGGEGGKMRELPRLSFRNIVWASHSESQEEMLAAATDTCRDGKMIWEDARRMGVVLWLHSAEGLKNQLEVIARNRFMADDDRDPTSCSLIFFALGKKKVVHGLWRQAPGHREQGLMLKFLANDFELDRWKLAAQKNAYALLSKQRYEYAAAFFMLAGSPKDAINVVLRQLDDWQLAFALARAVEGATDGPLCKWILTETVLPLAFEGGHRWLATWAFWTLGRRDLAVRVLITPMTDVARAYGLAKTITVGFPENDDPSLLLLFSQLRSKTLQTAKGTSEIPGKTEFDFVLHNARVFCRMGCHPLAMDLVRSWSFERAALPVGMVGTRRGKRRSEIGTPKVVTGTEVKEVNGGTGSLKMSTSPTARRPSLASVGMGMGSPRPSASWSRARRPSFMLTAETLGHGRRESMVMDMDMAVEEGGSGSDGESESGSGSGSDEEDERKVAGGRVTARKGLGGVKEETGGGTSFPWDIVPGSSFAREVSEESIETVNGGAHPGIAADQSISTDVTMASPKGAGVPLPAREGEDAKKGEEQSEHVDESKMVEEREPKKGMGNLMKEVRADQNQGAMEFDMSNFF